MRRLSLRLIEEAAYMDTLVSVCPPSVDDVPLVVDLDGTLIRTDLLVESSAAYLGATPLMTGHLLRALSRGKASLKTHVAARVAIDAANLPYNPSVIDLIETARSEGRRVYLASASHESYVKAIAEHLGLFDGWFASDAGINLSSTAKADLLVHHFGERGFDYIGNDRADLAVWSKARQAIVVGATSKIVRAARAVQPSSVVVVEREENRWKYWRKLLRLHQWAKNGLLFVPLLAAQRFDIGSILLAIAAFFAFSLTSSAIYVINDLVDIDADRRHPTKKNRPLAAGTVPILEAIVVPPILITVALGAGFAISLWFGIALCVYLATTTAYTFSLKRKMAIDVVVLAGLYTLRVLAGAAAISVPVSEWLLAFSMFIFTSLALIKRYIELAARIDADLPDSTSRGYRKADLDIVAALAAASGFNAVTVFALYISSSTVHQLYSRPQFLWLVCPILLYWLARALMLAHRRHMDDDPIAFALGDKHSYVALGLIVVFFAAAI